MALSSPLLAEARVNYLATDFEEGIPSEYSLFDNDGAELHFLMKQLGFEQGDSWIVMRDNDGNNFIGSPSMHRDKTKAADDWFITPPVFLRGDSPVLSWDAKSFNSQYDDPSSYRVYISATASAPGDDWGESMVDMDAPVDEWKHYELNLNDFEGQRVRIAFVNVSLDREVMSLDNIAISGGEGPASIDWMPGRYALGGDSFRIGARITAASNVPVTDVTLDCEMADGNNYTVTATGLNINPGQTGEVWLDHGFSGSYGSTLDYTMTATINGIKYDSEAMKTTMLAFLPERKVLLEEATGMWCGWCPVGIVAIDSLKMEYGDRIIPIAIHLSTNNNDALAMNNYIIALGMNGAPMGLFDRVALCDEPLKLLTDRYGERYTMQRGGFGTFMDKRINTPVMLGVDIATSVTGRKVSVETSVRAAIDVAGVDYRVVLVMVEDDVWKSGYYQSNYLPNFNRGEVGGFTAMPEHIVSDFSFGHVARLVADNAFDGIKGSLPASFEAGKVYTYTKDMTVPLAANVGKVSIVAMVVDASTGEVLNANTCMAGDSTTGLETVTASGDAVDVCVDGGTVYVSSPVPAAAVLTDLSGRTVSVTRVDGRAVLTPAPGLYILHVGDRTFKLRI